VPLAVSGGVSIAKTSPRLLERSNLYYTLLGPPLRPLVLEAIQRRLGRDAVRIGAHVVKDSARVQPPHASIPPMPVPVRPRAGSAARGACSLGSHEWFLVDGEHTDTRNLEMFA
jgi:hypothetical protein